MNKYAISLLFSCLMFSCAGGTRHADQRSTAESVQVRCGAPKTYGYEVINIYPHSRTDYTQGLFIHDGVLYEGTGVYGASQLKTKDLLSGRTLKEINLPPNVFGEGIALLDGKIYQLSWMEQKAMVYDAQSLKLLYQKDYDGEGWGLATDGRNLYMSDGSDRIYVVDPVSFARIRTVDVRIGSSPVRYINEMEWINGRIWANVYTSDNIVIIDPQSGCVEGIVDMRGLLSSADTTPETDVLNGIAYDAESGKVFVTGKNWNKLFEIEIKEK